MIQQVVSKTRYITANSFIIYLSNVIRLGVGAVISLGSTVFLNIYAGRVLGVEEFGKFTIALAFSNIVFAIANFGINITLTREASRSPDRANDYLNASLLLRAVISLLTVIIVFIAIRIAGYPTDVNLSIWGLSVYATFFAFAGLFMALYQAREWFGWMSAFKAGEGITKLVFGIALLYYIPNVLGVVLAWIISGAVLLAVCWTVYHILISKLNIHFDGQIIKYLFTETSYIALASIAWMVTVWINPIILSLTRDSEEVALYGSAYQLFTILGTSISTVLNVVMFPKIAKLYVNSKAGAHNFFRRIVLMMIVIGIGLTVIVFAFSKPIVELSFGSKFLDAVIAVKLFSLGFMFSNILDIAGVTLNATGHQKLNFLFAGIMLPVSIVLYVAIVPPYGYIGASVASVITYILGMVLSLYLLRTRVFN